MSQSFLSPSYYADETETSTRQSYDPAQFKWNHEFQAALDMINGKDKVVAIQRVIQRFRREARRTVRMIIDDLAIQPELRRIQGAVGVGGVAGGDKVFFLSSLSVCLSLFPTLTFSFSLFKTKFIANGIFFKVVTDSAKLYGGVDFAAKVSYLFWPAV